MAMVRALVFDLAGVLLDFGGIESLYELSAGRVGASEFHRPLEAAPSPSHATPATRVTRLS